ncbi:conserved hypothetical protein [Pediculus humanus corporis]|uniref:Uncharacterized protein n=1 Tax=Pediculus humanus subsp. corporis TaxID=121224 RepID=E0VY52_PEDHC|nr:uncharacterized protein Phum_PHUM509430 [Pediculus humanus corporis]EEB18308.1 conserved hypothetical protein [Pediculus humanus corporis]
MFSSGSLKKGVGSTTSDCSSPGRNSSVSRLPVGIKSIGDESQNFRIQLAVHKYNNSNNGSGNSNCNLVSSPVKNSFFKSLNKSRSYESGTDLIQGEKKFENRFLNNLPDLCSDVKTNNRSVLDVLQDLSRKRINFKNDNNYSRYRSKGLGGDLPSDENVLSKPLFVQKELIKNNNVTTTRDNCTQTLQKQYDESDPKAQLRRKLAKQNNEIFASLSSSIYSGYALKRKIGMLDKISTAKDDTKKGSSLLIKRPKINDNVFMTNNEGDNSKITNGVKSPMNELNKKSKKNAMTDGNAISPNKDRLTTIYLDMENTSPKIHVFENNLLGNKSMDNSVEGNKSISSSINNGSLYKNSSSNEIKSTCVESVGNFTLPSNQELSLSKSNSPGQSSMELKNQKDGNNSITISSENNSNKFSMANNNSSGLGFQVKFDNLDKSKINAEEKTTLDSTTASNNSALSTSTQLTEKNVQINDATEKNNTATAQNGNSTAVKSGFTFQGSTPTGQTNTISNTFKFGINQNGTQNFTQENKDIKTSEITTTTGNFNNFTSTAVSSNSTTTTSTSFVFPPTGNSSFVSTPATSSPFSNNNQFFDNQNKNASPKPSFTFGQTVSQQNFSSGSDKIVSNINTSSSNANPVTSSTLTTSTQFVFGQKSGNFDKVHESIKKSESGQSEPLGNNTFLTSNNNSFSTTTNNKIQDTPQSSSVSLDGHQIKQFPPTTNNTLPNPQSTGNLIFSNSIPISSPSIQKDNPPNSNNTLTKPIVSDSLPKLQSSSTFTFGTKTGELNKNDNFNNPVGDNNNNNNKAKLFSFGSSNSVLSQGSGGTTQSFDTATSSSSPFGIKPSNPNTSLQQNNNTSIFSQNTSSATPTMSSITQTGTTILGQNQMSVNNNNKNAAAASLFGTKTEPISFMSNSNSNSGNQNSSNSLAVKDNIFSNSSLATTNKFSQPTTSEPGSSNKFSFQTTGFGSLATSSSPPVFGTVANPQISLNFNSSATGFNNAFKTQPGLTFGATTTTQAATTGGFGINSSSQMPTFGQPFEQNANSNNRNVTPNNIFNSNNTLSQNNSTSSSFAPSTNNNNNNNTFNATTQNIFGPKPLNEQDKSFGSTNKVQTGAFGTNTVPSTQSPFTFGTATSNSNPFPSSSSKTSGTTVFTFGASTSSSANSATNFGNSSTSTSSSNSQTPFMFNNPNSGGNVFKFGASTSKENTGFGNANSPAFVFGSQSNNNNNNNTGLNTKPSTTGFNFGTAQSSQFNFGSTSSPSPSVFSFGSSGSASSNSTYNFGTPQPTGGPFAQGNLTPSSTFSAPGIKKMKKNFFFFFIIIFNSKIH